MLLLQGAYGQPAYGQQPYGQPGSSLIVLLTTLLLLSLLIDMVRNCHCCMKRCTSSLLCLD